MDTSLDNRMGLLTPNGDFDPVLELRRLRQDLMRRLQLLQQSGQTDEVVVEKIEKTVPPKPVPEGMSTVSAVKEPPQTESSGGSKVQAAESKSGPRPYSVPTRYETSLYVAPAVVEESLVSREQAPTKLDVPVLSNQAEKTVSITESRSETIIVDFGWRETPSSENTSTSLNLFDETVAASAAVAVTEDDPSGSDAWIAGFLGWINLCMVVFGACAAVWGCSRWTGLGLTVCLVGVTLILIGIVGRTLQQRVDTVATL